MVAIISRPGRTQQPLDLPGIDRSNALGSRVKSLVLRGTNLANGKVAAWSGTKSFVARNPEGLLTSLNGSSYVDLTNVGLYAPATAPVTLAFVARHGTPTSFGGVLRITPDSGAANTFCVLRGTGAGYQFAAGYATGTSLHNFSAMGSPAANSLERIVITCAAGLTSTTVSNFEVWVNGVKWTTSTGSSFGPAQTAGNTYFGWDGADSKFPGNIDELTVFEGKLGDADVEEYFRNPYQIYAQTYPRIWIGSVSSSGSTGTSATTNAADTSSASGTTTVTGSSAKTNANDTSSASGTTTVVGTSAKTNADDTSSASGAVGSNVTGTSATTNAADTSAASGTTTVVGTSSKTNSNDTASANGTTTVVGTSAQTNANDTATASGAAGAIVGTAAVTNANDYASANGVAVGSASNAAGRPTRRRYVVEIDGQDFIVESPDQARQLLDKATEAAEEKAEQALDRANKAQKRPQRKVMADARKALREPSIYAPEFPELAADVQRQIRAIYDSALQAIEISALLRKREEDEMDDEDILLLL